MVTRILDFHSSNSLSLVQVASAGQDSFNYISSERAIQGNMIEVKEVSQAGSVNSLLVFNHSDEFVFMMDGDILAGAKQNRVVNTSILLAPQSKTTIPVSCVEQGRWSHISPKFASTNYTAPSALRAEKARHVKANLERERGFASNQGEIWDHVAFYQRESDVHSATANLSDVYEEKQRDFTALIEGFKRHDDANGLGLFLGKQPLSIDLFNRRDIYSEYFPKLLRGAAMESFGFKAGAEGLSEAEAKYRTMEFLDTFEQLPFDKYAGVGVGEEQRFETGSHTGFELMYGAHMIHLTALKTRN